MSASGLGRNTPGQCQGSLAGLDDADWRVADPIGFLLTQHELHGFHLQHGDQGVEQ